MNHFSHNRLIIRSSYGCFIILPFYYEILPKVLFDLYYYYYCFECSLLLMVCRLNCVRGNSAHLDLDGVKKDQSPCMERAAF